MDYLDYPHEILGPIFSLIFQEINIRQVSRYYSNFFQHTTPRYGLIVRNKDVLREYQKDFPGLQWVNLLCLARNFIPEDLTGVSMLDIGYFSLSSAELNYLISVMKATTSLVYLNLYNNTIGLSDVPLICQFLETNSTLKILDLENTCLGPEGVIILSQFLINNNTLASLKLDRNYSMHSERNAVPFLSEMVKRNTTLVELGLVRCFWSDQSRSPLFLSEFSESLKINRTLKYLHLGENFIDNKNLAVLMDALKVNRSICLLDLHGNPITDLSPLWEVLQINPVLTGLNLGHLSAAQNRNIVEPLMSHIDRLTSLSLWSNGLIDEDVIPLATKLRTNTSLIKLGLNCNFLGTQSITALMDSLRINTTLLVLRLKNNSIPDKTIKTLSKEFGNRVIC